ncbi:protein PTST homolog 2, chloroplastic isoform X3 [Quercus suber]|uniref:protein PTST homolog 2, chloroplastic isoform X3 n=1 Tax=Quercus suber TaxID=58331 RepID=UPI0032DF4B07
MLSLTTTTFCSCSRLLVSPNSGPQSRSLPSVVFVTDSRRRRKRRKTVQAHTQLVSSSFVAAKESCGGGFLGFQKPPGFVRRCVKWDSEEGDLALEGEILEFMKESKNPEAFPSKKELVEAGRMDLVDAIAKKGGWLLLGWDLSEEEDEVEQRKVQENVTACVSDSDSNGIRSSEPVSWSSVNHSQSASSSVAGLESSKRASLSSNKRNYNDSGGKLDQNRSYLDDDGLRNSMKPDTWRTWSNQRAGFSAANFEAAEIGFNATPMDGSRDETLELGGLASDPLNTRKEPISCHEINVNEIQTRLQHLELELTSVLHSVRSNAGQIMSQKGHESSSEELQKLSDALEFQENEIMDAQDRLRSIRAKLTILEGKMALAIIDAQKVVEEKQERIDDARRALQLLHTTCIVWPNSASEVLLAGSFDGWATQRKMEKSSTGIFSLNLKLYPGRYEIKFIVDGQWKVDPLRPIVKNNGYENNLLIIT